MKSASTFSSACAAGAAEPFNNEPDKCDDLRWVDLSVTAGEHRPLREAGAAELSARAGIRRVWLGGRHMKPLRALLTLFCVQGLAAFLWTFSHSIREPERRVLVALGAAAFAGRIVAFGAFVALAVLALYVWRSSAMPDQISQTLDQVVHRGRAAGRLPPSPGCDTAADVHWHLARAADAP